MLRPMHGRTPLGLLAALGICLAGSIRGAAAPSGSNAERLYLLTYDHGGLVLWGHEHFAERLRNAVSWLDKYPGFKIGLDNEAHTYDVLARDNPQLLEEIRGYLKRYRGRFGIGTCTYGQPLSAFINEESNVRQLVQGIRADERHFAYTPVVYLMSEHAMHGQMPQLLVGCGFQGAIMRTHFMMYGYNPTFAAPIGWWVGLDGSRLPTVPTYPGEGATFGKTTVDNWILTRWPGKDTPNSLVDFRNEFSGIHPPLASRADDSGLRKEDLVKECEGKQNYRWLLLDELLKTFPKPSAEFRTQPNDFVVRMPWGYCGNEIWNGCRQAEVEVLTAERLAALELLQGGANHEAELETAWKNLLVAQHHDIQICGLLADARRFLPASLSASARVQDQAMRFFASKMKAEGLVQITAFNPVSWRRRQWLEAELGFPEKGQAGSIQVKHGTNIFEAVLLSADRYSDGSLMTARVSFPAELDGLSAAAFSLVGSKSNTFMAPGVVKPTEASAQLTVAPENLEVLTPFFEAKLAPEGGLAQLNERRNSQPLLKPDSRSAFFAGVVDGETRESKGRWTLPSSTPGAPSLTVREDGFIGPIPLTFHADTPRIDARVKLHITGQKLGRVSTNPRDAASAFLHEEKLRFKLFPPLTEDAIGIRDLPFAVAETTNRYVEGNYWTAVADGHIGIAVFNRGTMGSVRETDGSFSVPLAFAMNYIWGTRMLNGDFAYEFALFPFNGDWRKSELQKRALEYNFPVVSRSTAPGAGTLSDELHPVDASSDNVLLSALYPEHGHIRARLYECEGREAEAKLAFRGYRKRIEAVDLLGRHPQPAASPLKFKPWQIQTVQIVP